MASFIKMGILIYDLWDKITIPIIYIVFLILFTLTVNFSQTFLCKVFQTSFCQKKEEDLYTKKHKVSEINFELSGCLELRFISI